jgi:hypothetical protein
MNRRRLAYLLAIVVLLLPLAYLGKPATRALGDRPASPGGRLAQLRTAHRLSQADLGEIDAAGETIKLATFGLRPVAVGILWQRAIELMKEESWSSMAAVLEQLTRLQPNVISFWHFQGWNVSYNVSVEFDAIADRYFWVMKGIRFLQEGARRNARDPSLEWDLGWFLSQKIGRSDERKEFRQMFRDDGLFHGTRPREQRDNWLVGREYFLRAEDVVRRTGFSIKGVTRIGDNLPSINPLLFHSDPAMCLINYAKNLEEDGIFGTTALAAWKQAAQAWEAYGQRDILTVYNVPVKLSEGEKFRGQLLRAREQLAALVPEGSRESIAAERLAALSPAQREAHEMTPDLRSAAQQMLASQAARRLEVTDADVAARAAPANRAAALRAAELAMRHEEMAELIDRQREVVNFTYWRDRAQAEATDNAVQARQAIRQAQDALRAARLQAAVAGFDEGFRLWRLLFDKYPELAIDNELTWDLGEVFADYRRLLEQLDQPWPQPFILQDVYDQTETRAAAGN